MALVGALRLRVRWSTLCAINAKDGELAVKLWWLFVSDSGVSTRN
jgi:hypothetical protein